jgi:hypothetical protein
VFTEFITNLTEDRRLNVDGRAHAVHKASADKESRLCNTPKFEKAYEKLVASKGQWWRPKEKLRETNSSTSAQHLQHLVMNIKLTR